MPDRWRRRAAKIRRTLRRTSGRATGGPLDAYASLLPSRPDRVVVILADETGASSTSELVSAFPRDEVVVVTDELAAAHEALKLLGPVDVLVDLRAGSGHDHLQTWRRLFFHVRRHGAYLVARRSIGSDAGVFLDELGRLGDQAARSGRKSPYADAIGEVRVGPDFTVATKRTKHLLKARDDESTTRLLRSREPGLDVVELAARPPGVLTATGSITSYETAVPLPGLDAEIPYPAIHLRRYEGRIGLAPAGLAFHGHTVLPDSFRWHRAENPRNRKLINVDNDFARLRNKHRPRTKLPGSYYFLDYANTGHYGHLVTEAVSKFWGWDIAKEADPDLKVLLRVSRRYASRRDPIESRLLEAYGVARDDIVWVDEPVWVDSLVGASPMWHNTAPYHAHPEIRAVWDRLRRGMMSDRPETHRKVFITRDPANNRRCRNAAEVEALFESHGFEVVFPGALDPAHQADVFAEAEVVAGFGGTGLFNIMYAAKQPTLIVLNQEAYDSRNEHLYAAALGCDAHYFWSTPDVSHPVGGWSYEAFQSDWEFDFDRNGADLERLLRTLD